jgi:uncharacterized repeat protein (TIGR01451 family)
LQSRCSGRRISIVSAFLGIDHDEIATKVGVSALMMKVVISWLNMAIRALVALAMIILPPSVALADLRTPIWYDVNAVTTTPDWHYRVPINIPAATAVNSTIRFDVDFNALLSQMGVSGTFDVNSPRVVRSTGAVSTIQEFTDRVFAGATDPASNGRGEVRFLLEDAGAVTYYLYFDVTQNGAKPANPQTPINGNFEVGASGTATPLGWTAPVKVNATLDAQMRPSETVNVTANPPAVDGVQTRATDGNPFSGSFSYLLGNRSTATDIAGNPAITFTRDFVVPATNAGSITFRYRPEGWDTGDFDPIRIDLVTTANAVLVEMVGPTAGSYTTKPFAPNTNNGVASNTNSGFRQYNGFDCTLTGTHTLGMTTPCRGELWFTVTQSLAAYAGQTIRLRVRSISDTADKTWYHLDDVEWSVVTPTLGTPQAFGVNITTPATGGNYVPGQVIPVTAQVDALPTGATLPVTAQLYDSAGVLAAGGPYQLYNDGTHGDVTAGDAIWSNNGSITAQPAPTVPLSATTSTGWTLRVFARDATTSTIGAQNGLARGPGTGAAPETQANYWNIDEILFNVQTAAIVFIKTSSVVSDPANGTTNPKAIPGATVRYCLLIANNGPLAATNIIASDGLPPQITFVPGSMRSGASCAAAATVEDDDNAGTDESDPFGASFAAGSVITITSAIANGSVMALTFDAIVQ